jgi:F-type H+-transporting ATPase subunit epsilon
MPLDLEIVSPERSLLSRPVDMVVIPGTEGDIGVLPGHSKLITSLRGGLVDLYQNDRITDRFFVSGGFAEVTEERCTVLADEIVTLADLDAGKASAALAAAEQAYAATNVEDTDAYRLATDRLIAAQAMSDAVAGRG